MLLSTAAPSHGHTSQAGSWITCQGDATMGPGKQALLDVQTAREAPITQTPCRVGRQGLDCLDSF